MTPTIHNVKQGTEAWLALRLGRPTASEFDALITPKELKATSGKALNTYLYQKLTESIFGEPIHTFNGGAMEQGSLKEDEAVPRFQMDHDLEVQRVGFVVGEDGRCGCSPDGLIGEDGGLEIKCPERHTHIRYLCEGVLPPEYAPQCHGSLYVTGRRWWAFMSYCRGIQPFFIRVERNEEVMKTIEKQLVAFYARFDELKEKLK